MLFKGWNLYISYRSKMGESERFSDLATAKARFSELKKMMDNNEHDAMTIELVEVTNNGRTQLGFYIA